MTLKVMTLSFSSYEGAMRNEKEGASREELPQKHTSQEKALDLPEANSEIRHHLC